LEKKSMRASRLLRVGLVGAAAVVALAFGSPAWANNTIDINPGNVPTTAAGFDGHSCDANQGGGPLQGKDIWVFVLPGQHGTTGDFVSVTADFGANGSVTITAATDPGNFANGGPATSKAWIVTPAGWTLVGATAEITGTADSFNLTHTCPSSGSPSPSPSTSRSSTPSPSASASASPSSSMTHSGSATPSSATSATPSGSDGTVPSGGVKTGGGGGRPAGSLVWGLGALTIAIGSGVGLVLARRRRDNA
jgi:hypothetical protein